MNIWAEFRPQGYHLKWRETKIMKALSWRIEKNNGATGDPCNFQREGKSFSHNHKYANQLESLQIRLSQPIFFFFLSLEIFLLQFIDLYCLTALKNEKISKVQGHPQFLETQLALNIGIFRKTKQNKQKSHFYSQHYLLYAIFLNAIILLILFLFRSHYQAFFFFLALISPSIKNESKFIFT